MANSGFMYCRGFAANSLAEGVISSLIIATSARRWRPLGSADATWLSRTATGSTIFALARCAGIHGRSHWLQGFTPETAEAKAASSIKGTMIAKRRKKISVHWRLKILKHRRARRYHRQMIPRRPTVWWTTATPVNPGDTMPADLSAFRHFRIVSGLAFCLAMLPANGHAFTEDDQRRLCTGDVFRLCASEIPSVERITACMRKQRASLSDGCRRVFGKPAEQSASAR